MNSWVIFSLFAALVGANSKVRREKPAFEVDVVPRAVTSERKFLCYDASLPGYQIKSGIDAISIRPKKSRPTPRQLVIQLHSDSLEHLEMRIGDFTVTSSANPQTKERIATAHKSGEPETGAQDVPRGTYFLIEKRKGVFNIKFTPKALALLDQKCTLSWVDAYR